jgi:hypothetical protein
MSEKKKTWRDRIIAGDGPVVYVVGGLIVLAVVAGLWILLPGDGVNVSAPDIVEVESPSEGFVHPLTGMVTDEEVRPAVYAVVVENSADARPQDGVQDAFMVYEAPVEGNITRWLALFSADVEISEIGPVRSARPYFVDWAQEWNALFAHIGGSPEALEMIEDREIHDLNEFYWASSFWRSRRRSAPHNVYTETKRLEKAYDEIVTDDVAYGDRVFKKPTNEPEITEITIGYLAPTYEVTWLYSSDDGAYYRSHGSKKSVMRDGDQLAAQNIAVMITDIAVIDNEGRKRILTLGEGDAIIYQDGKKILGSWMKADLNSLTMFFDDNGDQIEWIPGTTWVEVIDPATSVIDIAAE